MALGPVAKDDFSAPEILSSTTPKGSNCNSNTDWPEQMKVAIRRSDVLKQRLGLKKIDATEAENRFPVFVPESFLRRMEPGNPNDPLLLQVLPVQAEDNILPGWTSDPVNDTSARHAPGLLQKYNGRALLITTGACAVHCRYCFRREYEYSQEPKSQTDWQPALNSIRADKSVTEVILSGGDPFTLTDDRLMWLCQQIDQISHVQRIRFHTRLPIVLPARITDNLINALQSLKSQVIIVVHANHPNEVADDCEQTLRHLVRSGIPILNQAVLLKHINDNASTLHQLCERLVNTGVMPYYLSLLDRVAGAAHFEVDESQAQQILIQLHATLPGYAVPKLVREIPGAPGKTPISWYSGHATS